VLDAAVVGADDPPAFPAPPLTFDPAGHHAYVLTGSRVSDW